LTSPVSDAVPLSDPQEMLFRQVHPNFVRDGRPSSQAFRPTKKDEGKLSVARGSMTSAENAFRHHAERLQLPSAGTWGVLVGECIGLQLQTFPDPTSAPPEPFADPAHAFVDFRELSNNQAEARGAKLARQAAMRDCLYVPDRKAALGG
jgi:hypothetical protein